MTPPSSTDDPDSPNDPKCPNCGGVALKYDDHGIVFWQCEEEDCEFVFGYHKD